MYTLSQLDERIASRSLLQHPFYVKWSKGELTLDDLRVYAKEYFHLAKSVPGIVSRVRDRALEKHPEMIPFIEENIVEETEHTELWKRFAMSLNISDEELTVYQPSLKTRHAVQMMEGLAERSFDHGVAAMYAMELELPQIAQTKKDGLCDFYDLTSIDAHIYFDEHLKEEKHLAVWRMVSIDCSDAEEAAEASLTAQNQVLDAVCDLCGIDEHC